MSRSRSASVDDFQQAGDLDEATIGQIYNAIADGPSRLQQAVQLYLHQYHPQTQHHTRATRRVRQGPATDADTGADTDTDTETETSVATTTTTDAQQKVEEQKKNTNQHPHEYQHPTFLLYPSLPASPFHARSTLAWAATVEKAHVAITKEFCTLWTDHRDAFTQVTHNKEGGEWSVYNIVDQGVVVPAALSLCPVTSGLVRSASAYLTTDCSLGYVYFSVITPGTIITPHTGVCNVKLRGHLPLIVPASSSYDCALTVANESRTWTEGELLLFDDSYTHSVRHVSRSVPTSSATTSSGCASCSCSCSCSPSSSSSSCCSCGCIACSLRESGLRVVLLFDYWHPALSEKEVAVVRAFLSSSTTTTNNNSN